jgi:hypothetical protein
MSEDRLAEIKARWFGDELHRDAMWADYARRDIPWLVARVEELLARVAELEVER